jgi:hypothetical protein
VTGDLTSIPVLEAEHHVASTTGEGHRCVYTVTSGSWPRAQEGESAGDTHGNTRGVASGTTGLEHHGISVTKGCGTVPRTPGRSVGVGSGKTGPVCWGRVRKDR